METKNLSSFNTDDTESELDDLGSPCQCSVLKRVWFGQYTSELTCIYEENIVHPN